MAWLAAFGLDFHEINEPYISFPDLQPALKFFNRYVTSKRLEYARQARPKNKQLQTVSFPEQTLLCSGGFCYLRQELDSSDVVAFPEEIFGQVRQTKHLVSLSEGLFGPWLLILYSSTQPKHIETTMLFRHVRPMLRGWWPLLRVLLDKGRSRRTLLMALAYP